MESLGHDDGAGTVRGMSLQWVRRQDALPDGPRLCAVFAPSDDNIVNPFIRISWYTPERSWYEVPDGWRQAITHWAPVEAPALPSVLPG